MRKEMRQDYSKYTTENHEVWSLLFEKQMSNLKDKACNAYLNCSEKISKALNGDYIPDYDLLNSLLMEKTGWSIEVVEGLIPVSDFYKLLSKRKFCAPAWIRSKDQIDYLEEPDMFHDIIGHIPLFLNEEYANYVQRIGEIGIGLIGNEVFEKELERIYWYTSEFGIMNEESGKVVYGAGIISSFGETMNVYSTNVQIKKINMEDIINSSFKTDIMQDKYYLIDSFSDLHKLLDEFELHLIKNSNLVIEVKKNKKKQSYFR